MRILDLLGHSDVERGAEQAKNTPGALLIDVRTPEEFAAGHLPGSRNIPLDRIAGAEVESGRPLFVYCRSGARSSQACALLRRRGYQAANIGGITRYHGVLEQGGCK